MRRTTYVCVCICVLAPRGCRESVFQKARCRLTPTPPAKRVCFSNVRSWWESEAALRRGYDCFPRKMEWRQRKGERESTSGDDDCFPLLAWLILPTEEIVRLSRSADRSLRSGKTASTMHSLSLQLSIPFSLFSLSSSFFFYLSVCHLVPIMFSQIIAFCCR